MPSSQTTCPTAYGVCSNGQGSYGPRLRYVINFTTRQKRIGQEESDVKSQHERKEQELKRPVGPVECRKGDERISV